MSGFLSEVSLVRGGEGGRHSYITHCKIVPRMSDLPVIDLLVGSWGVIPPTAAAAWRSGGGGGDGPPNSPAPVDGAE